jgi:HAD superfamily hydrolase (TIGR01549 family)
MQTRSVVLFDHYGTIADLEVQENDPRLWKSLARLFDDPDPAQLRSRFLQICMEEASKHGEGNILPGVFARMLIRNGEHPSEARIRGFANAFRELSITQLVLRPYTMPILNLLRERGIRICLVSNTESILTEYDIGRLRLADAFDAIVLSSDLKLAKPEPEIVDVALRRVGSARRDAVMVGDTWATDVEAGLAAGIPVVFLDDAAGRGSTVESGGHVIRVHPDLRGILDGLRQAGVRT